MKIHQIVSEANPLAALKAGWNAYKAARSAPAVANATTSATSRVATGGRAAAAAADTAASASWWEREAARIAGQVSGNEVALARGALKSAVLANKADDIVSFMYKAEILKEAGVYWYKTNQIDKDTKLSPEEKQEAIRKLRGEFILAIIAPKIGTWAAGKLALPLKIIPWLTRISGSPNAAELMKYLSKKGTEAVLIAWFGAGGGKEWLNDTMSFLVTGVGSAPELVGTLYEVVKAGAQVATGNIPSGPNKANGKDSSGGDSDDPVDAFSRAVSNSGGAYVDPFKGTGRGGK